MWEKRERDERAKKAISSEAIQISLLRVGQQNATA